MTRYIIVTETMCGNSYEWTTDDAGKETIYTYDSVEAAEKELAIDIEAFNEFKEPEYHSHRDEYFIIEYTGNETEDGRG